MVCHPTQKLVVAALEQGGIFLWCYGNQSWEEEIQQAHEGAAMSSVCFDSSGLSLITGAHDGSIKVWDASKIDQKQLVESGNHQQAHELKYEEGTQCLVWHKSQPMVASGGADGLVKVFELV